VETDSKLSDEDIREEVDSFLAGGYETTAVAMSMALYLIGANPLIQVNIRMLKYIF